VKALISGGDTVLGTHRVAVRARSPSISRSGSRRGWWSAWTLPLPCSMRHCRHASERGLANVMFVDGDVRTAALDEAPFDVVHVHQVLHYLDDPVTALRSMAKMTKSTGVVAAREGDYASMVWAPDDPRLDRWLSIYRVVLARNGGNPDGGRLLPRWARSAGLRIVRFTTSTWTFATADDRAWWGELWAERVIQSSFASQAIEYGVSDHAELAEIADAWRSWAATPDAVFAMLHGELIASPGSMSFRNP
jgi:SAM-dependent methyltransferase